MAILSRLFVLLIGLSFVSAPTAEGSFADKESRKKKQEERAKKKADTEAAKKEREGKASGPKIQFPEAPVGLELAEVRRHVERALGRFSAVTLDASQVGPWVIVHGLLGVGESLKVKPAGKEGAVPAMDWFSRGGLFGDSPAFFRTKQGIRGNHYDPDSSVPLEILEGHPNQFLGYLSELNVPLSHPWMAWDEAKSEWYQGTFKEVLEDAKSQTGINPLDDTILEMSWSLWAFSRYLDPDATWKNENGENWNIPKILDFEVSAAIDEDTSCAGNHRLYAMYVAVKKYLEKHKTLPDSGPYYEAWNFVGRHVSIAKRFQNADGSFSSGDYLSARAAADWDERTASNGHTLEFIAGVLPAQRLTEEWILRGAHSVASDLLEVSPGSAQAGWGSVFHAIHGLREFMTKTAALQAKEP
jgi:hypothetical protein